MKTGTDAMNYLYLGVNNGWLIALYIYIYQTKFNPSEINSICFANDDTEN